MKKILMGLVLVCLLLTLTGCSCKSAAAAPTLPPCSAGRQGRGYG